MPGVVPSTLRVLTLQSSPQAPGWGESEFLPGPGVRKHGRKEEEGNERAFSLLEHLRTWNPSLPALRCSGLTAIQPILYFRNAASPRIFPLQCLVPVPAPSPDHRVAPRLHLPSLSLSFPGHRQHPNLSGCLHVLWPQKNERPSIHKERSKMDP